MSHSETHHHDDGPSKAIGWGMLAILLAPPLLGAILGKALNREILSQLVFLIPVLPLLGAAFSGILGWKVSRQTVSVVTCSAVAAACVVAFACISRMMGHPNELEIHQTLYSWIDLSWIETAYHRSGTFLVDMGFMVDRLSAVMIGIITFVGYLIHVYSLGYMREDPSLWRFMSHLNLFIFFMLMLVLGDSMLLMFVGWEGVGLCSYLLIGFWYKENANADAGKKAFVVNRVGDFSFVIGVMLLLWEVCRLTDFRTLTLSFVQMREILQSAPDVDKGLITWACILLFGGAAGKSAQIPLYVWLPDAMAGPTPVSALIHAATMVTAGVYMIARMSFAFEMAPNAGMVVATVGALTCFFAATVGLAQNDIKKVLAYSTVSQLGYMFIAVGVGAYSAGIFHLMTHAFFKACLFLGSGSVILACHHVQDMRKYGGLAKRMPVTYWTFLISTLAIAGFPLTSGFFSKDEILWKLWTYRSEVTHHPNYFLWALGFLGAMCTAFYMFRLVGMTFWGPNRSDKEWKEHIHESPHSMTMPLAILAGLALVAGFLNIPHIFHYVGVPDGWLSGFEHWLAPVVEHGEAAHGGGHGEARSFLLGPGMEGILMGITIVCSLFMMGFAGVLYGKAWRYTRKLTGGMSPVEAWLALGNIAPMIKNLKTGNPTIDQKVLPAVSAYGTGKRLYPWSKALYQKITPVLENKYYVDELYDWLIIANIKRLTSFAAHFDKIVVDGLVNLAGAVTRGVGAFHGLFDKYVIDGIVNLSAWIVLTIGSAIRRVQTGRLHQYLYVVLLAMLILILFKDRLISG